MSRACTVIGSALAVLGVGIALTFIVFIARDDAYRQAELASTRNAGNVMYEAQFKGAQAKRAFQLVGVIAGILLSINGMTLVGLGIVASHVAPR